MKKILLIAAVAGMAMASCKKDYTCECTTTVKVYDEGVVVSTGSTSGTVKYNKTKEKDAKSKCESANTSAWVGNKEAGSETTVSCSLK